MKNSVINAIKLLTLCIILTVNCVDMTIVFGSEIYSAPIVITAGGTYQGNWLSDNPDVPAVKISTTEPVTIINSNIKSKTDLIINGVNNVNLTVRNCNAYGEHPGVAGRYMGKFIKISNPKNLVVENNYLQHANGIYVLGFTGAGTAAETIKIRYNCYVNMDNRQTTDTSFSNDFDLADGDANLKIVQFNQIYNIENAEISWNQVINSPFYSGLQDGINIFNSSGTAASTIKIHDNYIRCAYSPDPVFDPHFGVGIICDGSRTASADQATAYTDIYSNQVVTYSNCGICIAAGYNNNLYSNKVVLAGYLPDGQWVKAQNVGMYIWNCYDTSYFASNNAWDNVSGCNRKNSNGVIFNNAYWFPDAGSSTVNNSNIQGQITSATEQNEYQLWLTKLSNNQITIGSDHMPPISQAGTIIHKETFGYDDNTKLNTTTASGNWTTGWVANTKVASPTPLPDDYIVHPLGQVNLNYKAMYRGTSSISINGEYDYFFRWDQSLNSSKLSPSIGADLRLVAYDTNQNCYFGLKSLSSSSQGQYIPFFSLQGGDNNGGNSNIILNNITSYTIVGRLSSRNVNGTYAATGKMMAYQAGTTQPGDWMTQTYSASGVNNWQFQAIGLCGRTYDTNGSVNFKGLTVEKYTKAQLDPIETAVNTAISTQLYSNVEAARTQVATLMDGIAKDTFTAQLNGIYLSDIEGAKNSLYITYAYGDTIGSVTQNLTLPTSGINGTSVIWASSNTAVVANNGSVTRPTFLQGDATATLTATIFKGDVRSVKVFNVTVKKMPADEVILTEAFNYADNTKLNTTTASGNWTTGWVANTKVASPTPLPDDYIVHPSGQVNLNDKAMYRGTSSISINDEYDYFFRWDQSLNSSKISPSIRADLRLVAYDTNQNCNFGLKSLSSSSQGQYIPFFTLQGGDNNGGNSNIILNNNTSYTMVGRLSSRNVNGTYAATGKMMAYQAGTTQPGEWMTQTYSASGINNWQFQAIGLLGITYDTNGSVNFKGLTVEKYTKAQLDPIEAAVNTAISTKTAADISAARTQVAVLIDGIAKDTFTAQLDAIENPVYVCGNKFTKTTGATNDTINVSSVIGNGDNTVHNVTSIAALYYNNKIQQITFTPANQVSISAGTYATSSLLLTVPKNAIGYAIKYYVWNDFKGLKPYAPVIEQSVSTIN